jgi:hypothetical protein
MKKYILPFLLLCILAFPSLLVSAQAQSALSINPSSTSLDAGQSATLTVRITDVTDLFAYDITLHYDPSVVEITSIENGSFLTDGFTAAQILDKAAGTAQIAFTSIPPFSAQSGSGELASFKVKAKSNGSARISIENIQLLKKDASAIEATSSIGTVTVIGSTATEVSRPVTNPGGVADPGQPQQTLNPGNTASTVGPGLQAAPPVIAFEQPTAVPTVRDTVVPAAPLPTPEPETNGGVSPLVWMISLALVLLAAGYFGGNFLRERTRRK